jgi:CheY-like chemotaxis protein
MSTPSILICDDDALAVRALAREARAAGWTTIAETAASRVLPLALKHRPDLIVLDVHQLIDGRKLLVELRSDPRTSGSRVVMVSGSDAPGLEQECLKLGADAFLPKPFEFSALIAIPEFELTWSEAACTMLIADDSSQMVAALVRGAKREGFETLSDTTSKHVLELAKAHHPGVIVLDLHQAVDGRDLLMQLKADPDTRDIKVVMLSGEEDQHTRHDCFKLGAEDYFTKPLDPLFFRRIQSIVGLRS